MLSSIPEVRLREACEGVSAWWRTGRWRARRCARGFFVAGVRVPEGDGARVVAVLAEGRAGRPACLRAAPGAGGAAVDFAARGVDAGSAEGGASMGGASIGGTSIGKTSIGGAALGFTFPGDDLAGGEGAAFAPDGDGEGAVGVLGDDGAVAHALSVSLLEPRLKQ